MYLEMNNYDKCNKFLCVISGWLNASKYTVLVADDVSPPIFTRWRALLHACTAYIRGIQHEYLGVLVCIRDVCIVSMYIYVISSYRGEFALYTCMMFELLVSWIIMYWEQLVRSTNIIKAAHTIVDALRSTKYMQSL